ncbi:MAG: TetR/AcrR family transcriptional regulator [Casimicrobiaceae bacterium]
MNIEEIDRPEARQGRKNDPDQTRRDIIAVATREFARLGLAGARIDRIADQTKTSKRMIYYYFASKEGLYLAVLEEAYRNLRQIEGGLKLEGLAAEVALQELVGFTFDHHAANTDYVRLIAIENIHEGKHLAKSRTIQDLNVPAIEAAARVLELGRREGVFRSDIEPIDLHMSISALCFHNVSNRHTFSIIFKRDMTSLPALRARRAVVIDTILAAVRRR